MLKKTLALAAASTAFAIATPTSAAVFLFEANFDQGPNQGILKGTLDLDFVAVGGSGSGSAASLTLTEVPTGLTLPEGPSATTWTNQFENDFTVTNGDVTSFLFFAITAPGGSNGTELCLNSTGSGFSGSGRQCPSALNFLGKGGSTEFGFNFDGFSGVTFTPVTNGAIPEPTTWLLLILGFGAIGASMRRRKSSMTVSYS